MPGKGANLGTVDSILKEITKNQGIQDSRGPVGVFSRGLPIHRATSLAAHRGGGVQFGRPKKRKAAISRRLKRGKSRRN